MGLDDCLKSSFWFMELKDFLSAGKDLYIKCRVDRILPSTFLPSHNFYMRIRKTELFIHGHTP